MKHYEELVNRFNTFKNKRIINDQGKNCGLMLEDLLETSGSYFNIPDYYDIEIKATQYHEKKEIILFSHPPNGGVVFPMQYLSNKYGYHDHEYRNIKVLKGNINAKCKTRIGLFYYYKLEILRNERRIYLNVYNKYFKLIDQSIYWDFDDLKEMLERKIQNLVLFIMEKEKIDYKEYYIYKEMYYYRLRNFDAFISEIEKGNIFITINTGVYKSGYRVGQFVDHGCSFRIKLINIEKLFIKAN